MQHEKESNASSSSSLGFGSKLTLALTFFSFLVNCIANIFINSATFVLDSDSQNAVGGLMLTGQILQPISAMVMLICTIIMHRIAAVKLPAAVNQYAVVYQHLPSNEVDSHYDTTVQAEIYAVSASNVTNAVCLMIYNSALLACFIVLAIFYEFKASLLAAGILLVYPAMPLFQSVAVAIMIIMYYVITGRATKVIKANSTVIESGSTAIDINNAKSSDYVKQQ